MCCTWAAMPCLFVQTVALRDDMLCCICFVICVVGCCCIVLIYALCNYCGDGVCVFVHMWLCCTSVLTYVCVNVCECCVYIV